MSGQGESGQAVLASQVFQSADGTGTHQGERMSTKDTNPKDAIGIRKAPLSCVPMQVVAEVGVAMLEGAAKYGRFNYRVAGVRASVYYDALQRHMMQWWEMGENIDKDSGVHHITKAIATLMVLRDAMINGKCNDDRPPSGKHTYDALNAMSEQIIDRHTDKSPMHYTIGVAE